MSSKKKSTKSSKSSSSNNKNEPTFSESMSSFWSATKKKASEAAKAAEQRMTMEGLLAQARISLEDYLDPKVIPAEERMSRDILRGAKGIALITEAKGGFIVGVKGGSGVIMVKKTRFKKEEIAQKQETCSSMVITMCCRNRWNIIWIISRCNKGRSYYCIINTRSSGYVFK